MVRQDADEQRNRKMQQRGYDEGLHGLASFLIKEIGSDRSRNKHPPHQRRDCSTNKSIEIMPITQQYGELCIHVTPRFLAPLWGFDALHLAGLPPLVYEAAARRILA